MPLTIVDHPLAAHFLTRLRDRTTPCSEFRELCRKITVLLLIEATTDLRLRKKRTSTPMATVLSPVLAERPVVIPILRAGLGMLESFTQVLPDVDVGYIGLERDERTAVANRYYQKFPKLGDRTVFVLDPMLATGGSAGQTIRLVYGRAPRKVKFVCVLAAPEGVRALKKEFPKLEIFTAAVDRKLNAEKYIVPGLGDFGDRLYGTP
jgi:uracil phosphoribosyltransferase